MSPNPQTDPSCWLWGKSMHDKASNHSSLVAHSLAVGATFNALMDLPLAQKSLLATWGIASLPRASLNWAAASHDVGKAHPHFQLSRPDIVNWCLLKQGLPGIDCSVANASFDHGCDGGQRFWPHVQAAMQGAGHLGVNQWSASARRTLRAIMLSSFAHHGFHATPQEHVPEPDSFFADGIRMELGLAHAICAFHGPLEPTPTPKSPAALAHLLAGWFTLADWIGSDQTVFPFITCDEMALKYPDPDSWKALYASMVYSARLRLNDLKLDNEPDTSRWHEVVMGKYKLNSPQRSLMYCAREVMAEGTGGGLVIVEAPMGSGKTEGALLACGGWIDAGMAQGVSFALPAQASSNMVVRRMRALSLAAYDSEPNLAHANAKFVRHRMQQSHFQAGQLDASALLDRWITDQNKRAFLAPMTASTVDQMELAAMHSRHGFVRFASLSRQAVVIDEVHAYDAYMQRIVRTLLECLGAAQVPTVLLSATLPVHMRKAFCNAYARGAGWSVEEKNDVDPLSYPMITYVGEQSGWQSCAVKWDGISRKVKILRFDDTIVMRRALEAAAQGKCVAIMCNTVRSARLRYLGLKRLDKNAKLTLLHARFRTEDRALKQDFIEAIAGRDSTPEQRAGQIIIATQVLEQSIDIDVDFMISEPCPIDMLLQRMGRLFRHERPERLFEPVFAVVDPINTDPKSGPRWWRSSIRRVYSEGGKLLKSLELILEKARLSHSVNLPADIPILVAQIYSDLEDVEMTVEQSIKDAKAADLVLKLKNSMDHLTRGSIVSSATRDIEEEVIPTLMVVRQKGSGKLMIPTIGGDIVLPEMYSADGKRVDVSFLSEAQKWLLSVRTKTGTDDPDFVLKKTTIFVEAYRQFAQEPALDTSPKLPFVLLECRVTERVQGDRVKLFVGQTPEFITVHYDTEKGLSAS